MALKVGSAASWLSRVCGLGEGAMIGGLISMSIDPTLLSRLGVCKRIAIITGTNGKSTTTQMLAAALNTIGAVATNKQGANMDAGLIAALASNQGASLAALEVDEMHLPHVTEALLPNVIVLLNLSRDQLDRVGEIKAIEHMLRSTLSRHPDIVVVANCDDVLITSAAYECPHVVWVSAGGGWRGESVICPRSGEKIVFGDSGWRSSGTDFHRPSPHWYFDDKKLYGPGDLELFMRISLPGAINRGNATLAVAAAVMMGADAEKALHAVSGVIDVAGRYRTVQLENHCVRLLMAKNPAGWHETLSMVNHEEATIVISVNGQVPDGEDLSWLWDVPFECLRGNHVIAAGERGTDLAVRLRYAGVDYTLVHDTLTAIQCCPSGNVEAILNYSAFLRLQRYLLRRHD